MIGPLPHIALGSTAVGAAGHAAEHGPAVAGLLFLPPAILIFLMGMNYAASQDLVGGRRFLAGFEAMPAPRKLAILLLTMSAAIHIFLVPIHRDDPLTAVLFALDGVALVAVSISAFLVPAWRPVAVTLLVAN